MANRDEYALQYKLRKLRKLYVKFEQASLLTSVIELLRTSKLAVICVQ